MKKIKEICPDCNGDGKKENGDTCDYCRGTGYHYRYKLEDDDK